MCRHFSSLGDNLHNLIFAFNVTDNLFAALVTFLLNSVWHAILDNFRPITVWTTNLFIFYVVSQSGDLGEPWTKWSYIQLTGMFVLFYGTAGTFCLSWFPQ